MLNLLTLDTTAAAQAFLAFPVLWAAAHLRKGAVVLVTGTAVLADFVVLLLLQPLLEAAPDLLFFGAVLVVPAVMLTRANGLAGAAGRRTAGRRPGSTRSPAWSTGARSTRRSSRR